MAVVPVSARGLVGLAVAVCVWPVAVFIVRFGYRPAPVHVAVAACLVPCAVALLCAHPRGFRIATVVAGCAVGVVAAPAALGLLVLGAEFGTAAGVLLGFTLPVAAVAPLAAAYRRADGVEYGRGLAVVGWSAAGLSGVGWLLLIFG
ncbi:hypothetical protein ACFWP2_00330 [Kitasatospora sp. NPDC058444]|uniref:hypothetical protein n=1 Tax=Kitasatospora sp. NPDC058444 TaxID=3346504 RepID=UPI003669783E